MSKFTRRRFLSSAVHSFPILLVRDKQASPSRPLQDADTARYRSDLLELVNTERMLEGASPLATEDLASRVADSHAQDMADGDFLSHWGRDGRKPYHRYGDAGGIHAVQENVSAGDHLEALNPGYIGTTLYQMHTKMHAEVPPGDGHRRTILAPQHTHVGFGFAVAGRALRLVELYVARYVQVDAYKTQAKRNSNVSITGRLLDPGYRLEYAEVFFEPSPARPLMDWLREPRPYSLPETYKTLRPILPIGAEYTDGTRGEIETGGRGKFSMAVRLYRKEPGIYTVVIWISDRENKKKFEATNITIHGE